MGFNPRGPAPGATHIKSTRPLCEQRCRALNATPKGAEGDASSPNGT